MVRCASSARTSPRSPGLLCPRGTGGRPSMAAAIEKAASSKPRLYAVAAFALVAALGLGYWIWCMQPPPQMGADEEVFRTVDALYTAFTARDEKLLSDCEVRLRALHDAARLTPD